MAAGAAGLGLLVLTAALALRAPSAVGWAVLVCGAGYPAGRHGGSDVWAATAGALLLLAAELASWSIDEDSRIETERPVLLRRGAFVTALALGSFVVGLMLLAAAHVAAGASLVVAGAGVLAAVVAVAVVLRLVRGVGGQTRV
ncbi:MAG TPA: hypothetical protein VFA05_00505 [Gaiellaceae bacterium]|nr:hypothetical protein [Gaiellaceae bacterium]